MRKAGWDEGEQKFEMQHVAVSLDLNLHVDGLRPIATPLVRRTVSAAASAWASGAAAHRPGQPSAPMRVSQVAHRYRSPNALGFSNDSFRAPPASLSSSMSIALCSASHIALLSAHHLDHLMCAASSDAQSASCGFPPCPPSTARMPVRARSSLRSAPAVPLHAPVRRPSSRRPLSPGLMPRGASCPCFVSDRDSGSGLAGLCAPLRVRVPGARDDRDRAYGEHPAGPPSAFLFAPAHRACNSGSLPRKLRAFGSFLTAVSDRLTVHGRSSVLSGDRAPVIGRAVCIAYVRRDSRRVYCDKFITQYVTSSWKSPPDSA